MRRILLLSILVAFSLLHALTPITLQFGENEATYYREFLNLFDATADHDEALVTCILDGDIFTIVRHKTLNFLEVIHLIGVDAPDSTHSGSLVFSAKTIPNPTTSTPRELDYFVAVLTYLCYPNPEYDDYYDYSVSKEGSWAVFLTEVRKNG